MSSRSRSKLKKSCKYCKAKTSRGKRCKRLSACKIGCKNFCAQHAERYGGSIESKGSRVIRCSPPKIKRCSCRKRNKFPCSRKLTYFWNNKEIKGYCNMRKSSVTSRLTKKARRKLVHKYNEQWDKLSRKRTRSPKSITFSD